jgi:hypothetical protein
MTYYSSMMLAQESSFSIREEDYSLAPQGFRARTYWNDQFVLQKRDISEWERWQAVTRVLESTSDPDGLLLSFQHEYLLEEDCFYLRFSRFDLPGSPAHRRDITPEKRRELLRKALPDYLRLDAFLQGIAFERESFSRLLACHPQKTEAVMRYGEEEIRAAAKAFAFEIPFDYPKPLSYSYQHGDLYLGNTILTDAGYRLIDWESFAFHEQGRDLVHILCFVLLPSPFSEWESIADEFVPLLADHFAVSSEYLKRRVYWELLREFIFWQRGLDLEEKTAQTRKALRLED